MYNYLLKYFLNSIRKQRPWGGKKEENNCFYSKVTIYRIIYLIKSHLYIYYCHQMAVIFLYVHWPKHKLAHNTLLQSRQQWTTCNAFFDQTSNHTQNRAAMCEVLAFRILVYLKYSTWFLNGTFRPNTTRAPKQQVIHFLCEHVSLDCELWHKFGARALSNGGVRGELNSGQLHSMSYDEVRQQPIRI